MKSIPRQVKRTSCESYNYSSYLIWARIRIIHKRMLRNKIVMTKYGPLGKPRRPTTKLYRSRSSLGRLQIIEPIPISTRFIYLKKRLPRPHIFRSHKIFFPRVEYPCSIPGKPRCICRSEGFAQWLWSRNEKFRFGDFDVMREFSVLVARICACKYASCCNDAE